MLKDLFVNCLHHQRFLNGQLLSRQTTSTVSELTLTAVTSSDTGYYTCRASNDYSSVYSADAEVIVER